MVETTKSDVEAILSSKTIAVAGVSRSAHKFGTRVYLDLKKKGKTVFALNPNMTEFEGEPVYPSLKSLPGTIDVLITVVPPEITFDLVQEAHERGIHKVWMQQGSESQEAIEWAQSHGMIVVWNQCIMMHAEPRGFHKFHRAIATAFGGLPR